MILLGYLDLVLIIPQGETLALHWDDINFKERTIHITKSVAKAERGTQFKEPKTKTSLRTINIPETLLPIFQQYKVDYEKKRLNLGDNWCGDGNLFIQSDGRLMGLSTPYHYFKRHIEKYNQWAEKQSEDLGKGQTKHEILPDIPLHGLRHSCATLLNYLDLNIIDISRVLGHAKTSTTMNIYAHSFDEGRREASLRIDQFVRENEIGVN